jgi:selenocysteine-specific elongation factor
MPREELKSRLGLGSEYFQGLLTQLEENGVVVSHRGRVRSVQFEVRLDETQRARVEALMRRFEHEPYAPPSVKEARSQIGDELFEYLLQSGMLVQVAADVVFSKRVYEELLALVPQMIQSKGAVTVAELRDRLSTSRKYALALLEHLDEIGLTVRVGDERKLPSTH